MSPPASPESPEINEMPRRKSSEKGGRKRLKNKENAKSYKKIKKLDGKLKKANLKIDSMRKQLKRAKTTDSPRSEAMRLLRKKTAKHSVRRALIFHNTLVSEIKQHYRNATSNVQRKSLTQLIHTKLMRKYGLLNIGRKAVGIHPSRPVEQNKQSKQKAKITAKKVTNFLIRDDNSRITTGKRDTITKYKEKKQRRILTDTLSILHRKYKREFPGEKVSFALFCQNKPFWGSKPLPKDRETCLCKSHENTNFMLTKLLQIGVLSRSTSTLDACIESICCLAASEECHLHRPHESPTRSCVDTPGEPPSMPTSSTMEPQFKPGNWCVVKYEAVLYPGEILGITQDGLSIDVMHPIGENKFVPPSNKDICLYNESDIMAYIEAPQKPSKRSRFYMIDPKIWQMIH
jgi:hypothetical protein